MHILVYLPPAFYAGVATTMLEMAQMINQVSGDKVISIHFVSLAARQRSRSGLVFPTRQRTSKKIDALILLAGPGTGVHPDAELLQKEAGKVLPLIDKAVRDDAIIASICGASYFLAHAGLLRGRRATVSWWMKDLVKQQFPEVRWEPSRMVVRSGNIYTAGGGFSGFELLSAVLADSGFAKEEKIVRKLMVIPPVRRSQVPYEMPDILENQSSDFVTALEKVAKKQIQQLSVNVLARELHISERTLARRISDEFSASPGRWIREKKLNAAQLLLEKGQAGIREVCYEVGYDDLSSFSRLFKKYTGMTPSEYKRHFARE